MFIINIRLMVENYEFYVTIRVNLGFVILKSVYSRSASEGNVYCDEVCRICSSFGWFLRECVS